MPRQLRTLPWPVIPDLKKLTKKQRLALAAKIKYRVKRNDSEYMARKRELNRKWMKQRYYELRKDPNFLPKFREQRREYYQRVEKALRKARKAKR